MIRVCYQWGNASVPWNQANWTWSECQLVAECITWGKANVLWRNANWRWSECTSSATPPITSSVLTLQPPGIDAMTLVQPWIIEPWNPYRAADREQEKKKKLIKLICKVKGQTFEEEKKIETYDISVDDVKMVVKAVAGVDLDVKKMEE